MSHLSIGTGGKAPCLLVRVAAAAVALFLGCAMPMAEASSVVVDVSGTFGYIGYGAGTVLDDGSFSGSLTFASLPTANNDSVATSADVNFYDSNSNFVFNVGALGGYDQLTAGATGYTELSIGGDTSIGGSPTSVSSLVLAFSDWEFGTDTGIVQPYGPPGYSSIEYSIAAGNPGAGTYYSAVESGQASTVPEPSTMALSVAVMAGALMYSRCRRRPARA